MFVLSNYNKKIPFKISKKNNLDVIESQKDNIKFVSVENNAPVNYFCIKRSCNEVAENRERESHVFYRESLIPSKFFIVETIYEKPNLRHEEADTYVDLINDFGDKKSKNRIKKKDIVTYVSKQSITFNIENQILPNFDKEASSPRTAYSLELMIGSETLRAITQCLNEFADREESLNDHFSSFVKKIYLEAHQEDESKKPLFLALDCFYRALSENFITDRIFGPFRFFYDEFKDDLIRGRLSKLSKDRSLVKFYILLLIISDYETKMSSIPKFGETLAKITSFLRIIGCNIGKDGKVKLEMLPKDTFAVKKLKS